MSEHKPVEGGRGGKGGEGGKGEPTGRGGEGGKGGRGGDAPDNKVFRRGLSDFKYSPLSRLLAYLFFISITCYAVWQSNEAIKGQIELGRKQNIANCENRNSSILNIVEFVTFISIQIRTQNTGIDIDSAPGFEAMPIEVQNYFHELEIILNTPSEDNTEDLESLVNRFVQERNLLHDCEDAYEVGIAS
jgi:hypothetical protein